MHVMGAKLAAYVFRVDPGGDAAQPGVVLGAARRRSHAQTRGGKLTCVMVDKVAVCDRCVDAANRLPCSWRIL